MFHLLHLYHELLETQYLYNHIFRSHKIFYFESQESLVEELKQMMQAGDVILLKASNSMHFDHITKSLQGN